MLTLNFKKWFIMARKIDKLFIHCSATPEGRDVKTETIRSWHVKGRGWSDIGYHFVIELDGSVKAGRALHRSGAGVRGHNAHSIHVCYIGGIDKDKNAKDTRTDAQKDSLNKLISALMLDHPEASVHGHNEFSAKACPSFDVQKEFGASKAKAKKTKVKSKSDQ
jgi:N-acetylmuramoyl-L-alanine amidase